MLLSPCFNFFLEKIDANSILHYILHIPFLTIILYIGPRHLFSTIKIDTVSGNLYAYHELRSDAQIWFHRLTETTNNFIRQNISQIDWSMYFSFWDSYENIIFPWETRLLVKISKEFIISFVTTRKSLSIQSGWKLIRSRNPDTL